MDKLKFKQHFENSLEQLVDLTKQYCYNDLVEDLGFIIEPSGTDIHNDLDDFEKKNVTTLLQFKDKLLTVNQVVALLSLDGKVPLWINMTVYESRSDLTVIHLLCSRRLRMDNQLFYNAVKFPPFNVLVAMPPDPLRQNIQGKFDVNWKKRFDNKQKPKSLWTKLKRLWARTS